MLLWKTTEDKEEKKLRKVVINDCHKKDLHKKFRWQPFQQELDVVFTLKKKEKKTALNFLFNVDHVFVLLSAGFNKSCIKRVPTMCGKC